MDLASFCSYLHHMFFKLGHYKFAVPTVLKFAFLTDLFCGFYLNKGICRF
jgi:hypothetical protein